MLSRSKGLLGWCRQTTPIPDASVAWFKDKPAKYIAPICGNPYAFLKHDGVSDGFKEGFKAQEVNPVYRLRHNLNPRCRAVGIPHCNNPWGMQVHWLENKTSTKLARQAFGEECLPHTLLWIAICVYTVWQAWWYFSYHPDLTLYNLVLWPSKPLVNATRWDKPHPLDEPVFRYHQGQFEYYMPHMYREMVRAGMVVNDPWIELCKEKGVFDKLTLLPSEFSGRVWPDAAKIGSKGAHH